MIGDLQRILFRNVLTSASRERLMAWLLDCRTGETRLKAGPPPGWRIAQKTGTMNYHPERTGASARRLRRRGRAFPPQGADTIIIAAYTAGSTKPQADVDAWFASVARTVVGDSSLRD